MNTQTLQGRWNELRGEIRKRWGELTEDEIEHFEGDVDGLVGHIQHRTGQSREAIERQLDELAVQASSAVHRATETAREAVSSAAHTASEYASHAAGAVAAAPRQVAENVRTGYESTQQTVRRHPAESLAVAFGTGLIAGVVIGLTLRSR